MQTIRLRVNEKVYKQLMWFFNKFSKDDLQIIGENDEFLSIQKELHIELENFEAGKAEFIDLHQLDDELESALQKYKT